MSEDLQRELNSIATGIPDWRKTKILNHDGGILADAERIWRPEWWRRAEPRDAGGREIIALVKRAGLGTLRISDGVEEENEWGKARQNRTGTTVEEVIEHQRDREKAGVADELSPAENESIQEWFARLAKAIDSKGAKKLFWDALRAYASRFRGDVSAKKNLDAKLVATFLKNIQ
jgi:hypothetical protein